MADKKDNVKRLRLDEITANMVVYLAMKNCGGNESEAIRQAIHKDYFSDPEVIANGQSEVARIPVVGVIRDGKIVKRQGSVKVS